MFFGEPGPWFNQLNMDGDKTSVFHDVDGSVSEYPGSYLTKDDNWLVRHPDCIDVPDWRGAICSGRYAQVGKQGHPWCQQPLSRSERLLYAQLRADQRDRFPSPLFLFLLPTRWHFQKLKAKTTLQAESRMPGRRALGGHLDSSQAPEPGVSAETRTHVEPDPPQCPHL